ncbi:nucleotide exchange factor GrpE [Erythrobacter sp.]|jgi:molecular chaperone GrpE|uniref:nucleotide exchange factor GrpE n=1 Tax=Erythrobacter sp. TaxID=1042 RepID=UPI002EB44D20|nr:nucleotide exchange factor GrpE [Erythrobacter sp.]
MTDNDKPRADGAQDQEVKEELKGVPKEFLEGDDLPEGEGFDDFDEGVDHDAIAASSEISGLKAQVGTLEQEVLYAKAEAQNVRRRAEKDIQDARNYAATGFARDILSVWDNLSRAVEAIPDSLREDDKMKGLVTGIEATQRELEKVFKQHGITRVAAVGLPLDPNQHQAMIEIPSNDAEAGTVVQEMQSGWMIKDRLLRPAMVGVAKKPD